MLIVYRGHSIDELPYVITWVGVRLQINRPVFIYTVYDYVYNMIDIIIDLTPLIPWVEQCFQEMALLYVSNSKYRLEKCTTDNFQSFDGPQWLLLNYFDFFCSILVFLKWLFLARITLFSLFFGHIMSQHKILNRLVGHMNMLRQL